MLFRRLAQELADHGVAVAYLDAQSLAAPLNAEAVLQAILILTRDLASSSVSPSLEAAVADIVRSGRKWCLVIDEIERIARARDGVSVLDNLRYLVSNSAVAGEAVVAVCGGLDLSVDLKSSGSSLTNVCRPVQLEPLTDTEVAELIEIGCPEPDRERVFVHVRRLAGGHPHIAQMILEGIPMPVPVDLSTDDTVQLATRAHIQRYIAGIDPLLIGAAERLSAGEEPDDYLVTQLLGAGLARRDGSGVVVNGDVVRSALLSDRGAREAARRALPRGEVLAAMLAGGESETVEFKESVRWDVRRQVEHDQLKYEIPQAVAGLMNSDGGLVLIGVAADGSVAGIGPDMALIRRNPTPDGVCLLLSSLLRDVLGGGAASRVSFSSVEDSGRVIIVLSIEPAQAPVFAHVRDADRFFKRIGTATVELDARETVEYVLDRWPQLGRH